MQFSTMKNMINFSLNSKVSNFGLVNKTNPKFVVIPIKHHILNTVLNRPIP